MLTKSIISVDDLYHNLDSENLIILDCTIAKITDKSTISEEKKQIKGAVFFDIKNVFSDKETSLPNTVLSPKEFQEKAQDLGINKDSFIVCYDDIGIYASPRVWWMFQLMGFQNIAVLDGGLPKWNSKKYPVEVPCKKQLKKGNFIVNYKPKKLKFTQDVLTAIEDQNILIVDARSKGRFLGIDEEPRKEVKSGHIPNSVSLPYSEIQENGKMKSSKALKAIFDKISKNKKELIFSCGTGITASILALGADLAGIEKVAVYDGSWTEWGSTENLPIEL
ncbi:sulfurtransferase [Polaribacter sp. MSW13]|uniref:Sulfurtransferase n=1 Tax=Polaribacter marinus TaxID=2916838 RepID=A0A9X2AJ82_9FLAO|nr:sulfurtransferase [Polaribacter marinus]MCI2228133.1 sulfurtransferase [Polaribacter marinus]